VSTDVVTAPSSPARRTGGIGTATYACAFVVAALSFVVFGLSAEAIPEETILVRGGVYCGRRFDSGDLHAIWFLEESQVKFYGPNGLLRQVLHPAAVRYLIVGVQPAFRTLPSADCGPTASARAPT